MLPIRIQNLLTFLGLSLSGLLSLQIGSDCAATKEILNSLAATEGVWENLRYIFSFYIKYLGTLGARHSISVR